MLHRIEFRSIGRKEFQPQASALLADKVRYQVAAMTGQAIPNDRQLARQMTQQIFEEPDHLRTFDSAGKEPKVKVPPRYPRHRRQGFPVEVILQHRSLSPRRPGAGAVGPFAEPALVDENYDPALLFGLFFSPAPPSFFQRSRAFSSPSSARPAGRWQLQPSCRRIFHTCPG